MFRSINSKFNAIVVVLIIAFAIGYSILAYLLHRQNHSTLLAQEMVLFQRDFSTLNRLFNETRLREKEIFTQNNPEAEMQYGALIEETRQLLVALNRKDFDPATQLAFAQIRASIDRYDTNIDHLIQLKIKQSLIHTRMETNYRAMVSIILSGNDPSLIKPLLSLTLFLTSYRDAREPAKYQALKLVIDSIDNKVTARPLVDARLFDYLRAFGNLLEADFALESQIFAINAEVGNINNRLRDNFARIASISERFLQNKFQDTDKIRKEMQSIFLISAILSGGVLLMVLFLISRKIIMPVRSMALVMQEVRAGDIDARFHGQAELKDELTQLGLSLNDMLDTLARSNQKLVAYQKELEEKINELSEREKERQRLTAQLQRAQKMEAVGTLAAGVAHDLNNVLSGIVSYPEMLLLDLDADSPFRQPFLTIQESGQKAAAIVQDLLTLARRGVAEMEITNLNDRVSEYLASPAYRKLRSSFPDVDVIVDTQDDLLNIRGSSVHLMKTIMNLAANAAESIPGAGQIRISTRNQYIDRPIRGYDDVEEGDYAVFQISDTGTGIAPEDLERIFEPFFTKKIMGRSGSGLGMAVVWGTVKDHRGYIDVHSVTGQGTRFCLYFPATRQSKRQEPPASSLLEFMGNGELILVVDDVRRQREITMKMLIKLGYRVATAASGEHAVEHLKTHHADLVVLDMIMEPGMNGLATYQKILEIVPGQKAVIASGYSEDDHVKAAQRLGAGVYIKKPFTIAKFGAAVKEELARSATGQACDPPRSPDLDRSVN